MTKFSFGAKNCDYIYLEVDDLLRKFRSFLVCRCVAARIKTSSLSRIIGGLPPACFTCLLSLFYFFLTCGLCPAIQDGLFVSRCHAGKLKLATSVLNLSAKIQEVEECAN